MTQIERLKTALRQIALRSPGTIDGLIAREALEATDAEGALSIVSPGNSLWRDSEPPAVTPSQGACR